MVLGIGTPDSSGNPRHRPAPCRMNPAFLTLLGPWAQGAIRDSWSLPTNLHVSSGRDLKSRIFVSFMPRLEFMWARHW